MYIQSSGLLTVLRPVEETDLETFAAWRPYPSVLQERARMPYRSLQDWQGWLSRVTASERADALVIETIEKQIVGVICCDSDAKAVGPSASAGQSACLSMQIDVAHARRGYGFDAMVTFLDNAFPMDALPPMPGVFNLQFLECSVPAYNTIAARFLNQIGFVCPQPTWFTEPMGRAILDDPEIRPYQRFIRVGPGGAEVMTHVLELARSSWLSRRNTLLASRKERAESRMKAEEH